MKPLTSTTQAPRHAAGATRRLNLSPCQVEESQRSFQVIHAHGSGHTRQGEGAEEILLAAKECPTACTKELLRHLSNLLSIY